jgi:hypothetical protein
LKERSRATSSTKVPLLSKMDDFYSAGPSGKNTDDDFFAGGPSGSSFNTQQSLFFFSDDFFFFFLFFIVFVFTWGFADSSSRPGGSNPFDAPAVDFSDAEIRQSDDFFGAPSSGAPAGLASPARVEGDDKYPWQIGFWRSMFDVDTKEVGGRVLHSLVPFRRSFVDSIKAKPDLWAPFWICSTLIFFMTWTGNFAGYLNSVINDTAWVVKVDRLPYGALVVYGYWLVIPLIFWGVFRWREVPITLLMCYAIFGYSLFCYIPISVVAIAALGPIQWLSWLLIMLACAYSTLTLAFSFFFLVHELNFKPGYIMILIMMACSVGLGLSFKLYFFAMEGAVPVTNNVTTTVTFASTTAPTVPVLTTAPSNPAAF